VCESCQELKSGGLKLNHWKALADSQSFFFSGWCMSRLSVLLPQLQNWGCHNCGGCCREHQITITDAEHQRIERQCWTAADGVPADRPLMVSSAAGWRLNHQDDGACVFLDAAGLCRIHSKYGESAKPLACRMYPYAIHPAGSGLTASLRFSCPSVVQNLGAPVAAARVAVEALAAEAVAAKQSDVACPELRAGVPFDWSRLTRLLAWLERGLEQSGLPFVLRLQRLLGLLELLELAGTETVAEDSLGQLLPALYAASERAYPAVAVSAGSAGAQRPQRLALTMLRQLAAQLLRHDTAAMESSGPVRRLGLLCDGLRMTLGWGWVPEQSDPESVRVAFVERAGLSERRRRVRFTELESVLVGGRPEIDELFHRYFHVKLQGRAFCGPAFYGYSVIDGLRSLVLMYPAVLWVARLRAAAEGRGLLELRDVQAALATLDHNFGYSPVLALAGSRRRVRQLAQLRQIAPLVAWYGR
jgi:lysine-N-methylase